MSSVSLHKLPFWLHSLIELIPSIVFLINPASQFYATKITSNLQSANPKCYGSTATPTPGAETMMRQYGVLLFVSVIISTIFAIREVDKTSRQVAAALTLYHLAPTVRATSRLWGGETGWLPKDMGGPWVHLVVHIILVLALGSLALGAPVSNRDQHEMKVPTKRD
jgi:uncharacterized membrane protein